jgi:hypothetical protein
MRDAPASGFKLLPASFRSGVRKIASGGASASHSQRVLTPSASWIKRASDQKGVLRQY